MRVSSRIRNDLPGALLHARVAVRVVALHFSESCLANPRMPVRVSLRYCVPIKRPDNVSEWHLMKNLEAIEASNVVACANLRSREIGLRGPEPIKSVFDHSDFPIDEDEDGDLRWYKRKDGWTRDEYWDVYWHESGGYPATISYLSAKAASKVLNDAEHGISLLLVTGGQYCYNSGKHEIREFFMTWNRKEDPPPGSALHDDDTSFERDNTVYWSHQCGCDVYSFAVSTSVPEGVAQNMEVLCKAFGLEMEAEPSWRMIEASSFD